MLQQHEQQNMNQDSLKVIERLYQQHPDTQEL